MFSMVEVLMYGQCCGCLECMMLDVVYVDVLIGTIVLHCVQAAQAGVTPASQGARQTRQLSFG